MSLDKNFPQSIIVNHKHTERETLYQVLDITGDQKDTVWLSREELPDFLIVNYYKKRIRSRQENLRLPSEDLTKNPLSVMNHFDPPEETNEDSAFFSSLLESKPVYLNDSSLNSFGIEDVKSLPIPDNGGIENDETISTKQQQQLMIMSDEDAVFVSPSCLACFDQNLFLQIYEKGNENE